MSGFRDSLKGQYCGELGSGLVLIARGRGWVRWRGKRQPVGVGQLFRKEGEGRGGDVGREGETV